SSDLLISLTTSLALCSALSAILAVNAFAVSFLPRSVARSPRAGLPAISSRCVWLRDRSGPGTPAQTEFRARSCLTQSLAAALLRRRTGHRLPRQVRVRGLLFRNPELRNLPDR